MLSSCYMGGRGDLQCGRNNTNKSSPHHHHTACASCTLTSVKRRWRARARCGGSAELPPTLLLCLGGLAAPPSGPPHAPAHQAAIVVSMAIAAVDIALLALRWLWYEQYITAGGAVLQVRGLQWEPGQALACWTALWGLLLQSRDGPCLPSLPPLGIQPAGS